jgi:hypothetical protein
MAVTPTRMTRAVIAVSIIPNMLLTQGGRGLNVASGRRYDALYRSLGEGNDQASGLE